MKKKALGWLAILCFATVPAIQAQTPCTGGSAGGFACDGIDFLSLVPIGTIGGGNGNDIWGWTDPQTGREYALMGRTNGTAFVDVTDPVNPIYLGNLPTQTVSSSWRDIKTFSNHAYIVADSAGSHGMQVFDLTQLRNVPNPPVTFSPTTVYSQFGSSHNIVINETSGFAYAVDSGTCSGGLHMIDISSPASPVFAGCHSADGTIHDAQCVSYIGPDPDHQGAEVCFTATLTGGDTMDIIDVTNKSATVTLSSNSYGGASVSHQGWLTEDHRFFFHGDEGDETSLGINTRTYIFNVTDLDNPVLIGNFTNTTTAIDHNLYVKGNLLYEANYTSGLRIIDITGVASANLNEIAFFDTRPESNAAVFQGAWSVYPFFDSGTLIVSDIERGLFVLRQANPAVCGDGVREGSEECDGIDFGGATCGDGGCTGGSLSCTGSCTIDVSGCTGCPTCSVDVDFDDGSAAGWTNNGASTCSTGSFVVATPTQQVNGGVTTQVGGDHTSGTGNAFFSATNTSAGTNDVDGGTCIVESPIYPVTSASDISIWYFHGQRDAGGDAGDFFLLEISTDGGATYSPMVSIGDVTLNAAWTEATANVPGGSDVRFRVQVADGPAGGDLVEGGVDDLLICSAASQCTVDADCNDGLFCNGSETCNAGTCQAGTAPNCDDGVSCTVDSCNEATDSCDSTPNDGLCSNGLFCDGVESCDAVLGCQAGSAPNCDDGVSCTNDSCNEGTDSCDNTPDNGQCDDGLFCNGAEVCNATLGCQAGSDPCSGGACDETGDVCLECTIDADCDDGLFCNGAESCVGGACQAGADPCPGQGCDEGGDVCLPGGACSHDADFESGAGGWTQGADTCTTGAFIVGTPDATTWQVGGGNPGQAFFTANNPGGIGTDDVDGGTCEALSPVVDCAGQAAAEVTLDYFHGQRDAADDAGDGFTIEVLNNGAVAATLVSIGDVTNNPAWTTVSATVTNPGNIQVRVRATDAAGGGDIVEGGVDNVSITATVPPSCTVDEDFESGSAGWANDPASTCTTGDYVLGNPTNPGGGQQIVGSNSGTGSLFTAVNTAGGTDDVDGGNCILNSPTWSVGTASTLSVWYWHGQRDAADDAAGDFFLLEVSTDGGATWSTLASNGDTASTAVWTNATAAIPAGSNVALRMQCSDGAATGDLVECGLDDVSICN